MTLIRGYSFYENHLPTPMSPDSSSFGPNLQIKRRRFESQKLVQNFGEKSVQRNRYFLSITEKRPNVTLSLPLQIHFTDVDTTGCSHKGNNSKGSQRAVKQYRNKHSIFYLVFFSLKVPPLTRGDLRIKTRNE